MTAVARSNYDVYAKGQVTLDTDRFGKYEGWKPYRGELPLSSHPARL